MRIGVTRFHLFQITGFISSILVTLLLIKNFGKKDYGLYSYYFTFSDLLATGILLGYDQSINLIKVNSKLLPEEEVSKVFSSKLIIYLILLPFPFIFANSWQIIVFCFLMMSLALFDRSYLYMQNNNLSKVALNFLISRLIFLGTTLLIINFTSDYKYYLLAYSFAFGVYVLLGMSSQNNRNLYYKNISFSLGFKQILLVLPIGFSRIFIFIEMFLVLTIFRNSLDADNFGAFMISYSIAKLISGGISIFITPIYNKVTLDLISVKEGLFELFRVGLFAFLIVYSFYSLFDFSFISSFLNINNYEFVRIIENAIVYAAILYITSVVYNITILAKNKPLFFYSIRSIFLLLLLFLINLFKFKNEFLYLIIPELLIISIYYLFIKIYNIYRL